MAAIGGNSAGPGNPTCFCLSLFGISIRFSHLIVVHNSICGLVGDAVVNVYINHEKKFAFVEMRTVEEASNAMALDGIMFEVCPFFKLASKSYIQFLFSKCLQCFLSLIHMYSAWNEKKIK